MCVREREKGKGRAKGRVGNAETRILLVGPLKNQTTRVHLLSSFSFSRKIFAASLPSFDERIPLRPREKTGNVCERNKKNSERAFESRQVEAFGNKKEEIRKRKKKKEKKKEMSNYWSICVL